MSYLKFTLATFVAMAVCLIFTGCDSDEMIVAQRSSEEARLTKEVLSDASHKPSDETIADLEAVSNHLAVKNTLKPNAASTPTRQAEPSEFVVTLRQWRDANSLYSTNAELLSVARDTLQVKLLKENGVTIVVPFKDLSVHDQNYVLSFVEAAKRTKHVNKQREIVDRFTS